jgi:hypothetical protein
VFWPLTNSFMLPETSMTTTKRETVPLTIRNTVGSSGLSGVFLSFLLLRKIELDNVDCNSINHVSFCCDYFLRAVSLSNQVFTLHPQSRGSAWWPSRCSPRCTCHCARFECPSCAHGLGRPCKNEPPKKCHKISNMNHHFTNSISHSLIGL